MQPTNQKRKDHDRLDDVAVMTTTGHGTSSQQRKRNGNHSIVDDMVPQPTKRQRVSQACEQCRSKKYKCDAIHPTCSACSSSNEPCFYRSSIKKRGLPTGYVRVLEMLWGAVILEHPGSEAAVGALLTTEERGFARMEKDGAYSDVLLKTWRKSTISKAIDRYLGNEETLQQGKVEDRKFPDQAGGFNEGRNKPGDTTTHSEPVVPHDWTRHITVMKSHPGVTGNMQGVAPQISQASSTSWANSSPIQQGNQVSEGLSGAMTHSKVAEPPHRIFSLALPSNAMRLINVYISYTHCWFPIVERGIFWKVSFHYSGRTLRMSGNTPGSGKHAALWVILTYASIQEAARSSNAASTGVEGLHLTTEQMHSNARGLIPSEDAKCEGGHVQALLLLVLVNLGLGNLTAAWLLVGQAVRRAIDMGLGSLPTEASGYGDLETSSGSRKHIFLGCLILDTLVSARLGRCPHLRKEDATQADFIRPDGPEEYEPWRDCFDLEPDRAEELTSFPHRLHVHSIFLQFTRLAGILNGIICDGLKNQDLDNHYREVASNLHQWAADLPGHCRLPHSTQPSHCQSSSATPQLLNLHLMYQNAIASLQLQYERTRGLLSNSHEEVRQVYFSVAGRSLGLLEQFSSTYGVSMMPPIFQYFASVVSHDIRLSANQNNSGLNERNNVQEDLHQLLSRLKKVWATPEAASIASTIHLYDETRGSEGTMASSKSLTEPFARKTLQQTEFAPQLLRNTASSGAFNQSARSEYNKQFSDSYSQDISNVMPAVESEAYRQDTKASIETFPMWHHPCQSVEPYSMTSPSANSTHPAEVTMTGLHDSSNIDATENIPCVEWRNHIQQSPSLYAVRSAPLNQSTPYANPGILPSNSHATSHVPGMEIPLESPFSLPLSTGNLEEVGNSDAVWDELAGLDDGERCVLPPPTE